MKRTLLTLASFLVLTTTALADSNVIGTVLDAQGQASVISGGMSSNAAINMDVHPGDVLNTGPNGRLFVQLIDNTELTLGENGQMTVNDYVFNDKNTAGNHAVYSILKGAFLFVDGLLGKTSNPNIKVNIPNGSIGIRGTKFWGGNIDGIYGVIVGEGQVVVANAHGQTVLGKGQATTIASANTQPDAPQTWAQDKIARATATVALPDAAAVGQRMQANSARNQVLRAKHDAIILKQQGANSTAPVSQADKAAAFAAAAPSTTDRTNLQSAIQKPTLAVGAKAVTSTLSTTAPVAVTTTTSTGIAPAVPGINPPAVVDTVSKPVTNTAAELGTIKNDAGNTATAVQSTTTTTTSTATGVVKSTTAKTLSVLKSK